MSALDTQDPALTSYMESIFPLQLCTVSTAALMVYDSFLTFDAEFSIFWRHSWNVSSVLYFVNRYVESMSCICAALLYFPVQDQVSCAILPILEGVSTILPYLSWAVFSAFRAYALTDRNRCLTIVVFILVASFLVPDVYEYAGFDNVNLPAPYDCSRAIPPGAVLRPRPIGYASCQHTRRSHCSGYNDSEDIRVVVRRTGTGPTSSSRRSASDQRCSMFQHPTGSERPHISPYIDGL
ncbi:hypothetical protein K466DRAFT_212507 [Polyporus arcularius HHB13444]|uniref:DUF6533 domain-containing protein n=1 Tax=Polyporus arcularius HHB13444 TaxID=1314778 RepID=A0A5C3PFX0_9APHY|nr:hypothetical protein K466DRAFT_212507 [Polyporus arcularius HHB13444]